MRAILLPACLAAFVQCVPAVAQTPLSPVWSRTWPYGQQGPGFVSPSELDNHVAVDPVTGYVHVSIDDQLELASPRWDFLFTTSSDGTDLTPVPTPLLGSVVSDFPGANVESTVDLAVLNGDVYHERERNSSPGSGTAGSACILRANGSIWQMGFGTFFPVVSTGRVAVDEQGAIWVRSLDGNARLHGITPEGWLEWSRPYAPTAAFDEVVLMGNEAHACRGGLVRRVDRSDGDPLGSYSLYTGSYFTQLATDGTNAFFAFSDGAFITIGARTTSGGEIWTFSIESDYTPTELKVDATGHAWLTANSANGDGPGMLFVVNPDGMAQWFTYGASMNDLDLDDEQVYITGRSDAASSETYLIAIAQDMVTGVHATAGTERISIYPQPASDVLRIRMEPQVLSAQALDANGRLVLEQAQPNGTLDVSALANGTYVLQLRTADGLLRKPFVVAR